MSAILNEQAFTDLSILNHAPDRGRRVFWNCDVNKPPQTAAVMDPSTVDQAAMRLYSRGNKDLLLTGTNVVAASQLSLAGGGFSLVTAATANDSANAFPGQLTSGVELSGLNLMELRPDTQPIFDCVIQIPTVTSVRVLAGLRLTAPATLNETTDDDLAMFAFATGGNGCGGDTVASTTAWRAGVKSSTVATDAAPSSFPTVVAGARYRLRIEIAPTAIGAATYRAIFKVWATPATAANPPIKFPEKVYSYASPVSLLVGAAFKPIVAVQTLTTAARSVMVRNLCVSRLHA